MQPKPMLSEEPTSALDPELVGDVLAEMRDPATSGMTMIVVTPRDDLRLRFLGDTLVFIADGVVIEPAARERRSAARSTGELAHSCPKFSRGVPTGIVGITRLDPDAAMIWPGWC